MSDRYTRWARLLLRCIIAGGGALITASHGGTYALTVWVWVNVLVTVCTTAEAGLSASPTSTDPVPTINVNPKSDPVLTQPVPKDTKP